MTGSQQSNPINPLWWLAGTVLWVAMVHQPELSLGYFDWDDSVYVLTEPVANGLSIQGLLWSITHHQPFFMPLTWLSFMAEISLAGQPQAELFHFTNLMLHLVNVSLSFFLARSLTSRNGVALTVAALMGLHPQHVEAVAWIAERKELLAFLFGTTAILCQITAVRRKNPRWHWAAVGCFLLSLLAKPQWITLPFLLLLLDYWPLGRQSMGWRSLVVEKWPFFAMSVLFSLLTLLVFSDQQRLISLAEIPFSHRLINSLSALAGQLSKTFWPQNLAVLYPAHATHLTPAALGPPAAALLLLSVAAWRLHERHPHWAVGWLWFLGGLFPTLGLVNGGVVVEMADRWGYLPHFGLFLALTHGLPQTWPGRLPALLALLLVFSLLTRQQIGYWQDNEHLWRHTLQATQPWPNPHAHWMLGALYRERQQGAPALEHMAQAHALQPDNPFYIQGLAQLHFARGDTRQGLQLLDKLPTLAATTPAMRVIMAHGLVFDQEYPRALTFLAPLLPAVARPDPNQVDALFLAALAHAALGQSGEAEGLLTRFITLAPGQCPAVAAILAEGAGWATLQPLATRLCSRQKDGTP